MFSWCDTQWCFGIIGKQVRDVAIGSVSLPESLIDSVQQQTIRDGFLMIRGVIKADERRLENVREFNDIDAWLFLPKIKLSPSLYPTKSTKVLKVS